MRPNLFIEDYLDKDKDKLFIKFCKENNYDYLDQITDTDYILFSIKYKLGRQKYKELQKYIDSIKAKVFADNIPVAGHKVEVFDYKIRFGEKDGISLMNLSTRAHNALHKNKIYTILDLFVKSEDELHSIRALGVKTFNEILRARRDYFPDDSIVHKAVSMMSRGTKNEIINLLTNDKVNPGSFKNEDSERMIIQYAKTALQTIGNEIAKRAYEEPAKMKALIESMNSFSLITRHAKEIQREFDKIPAHRLEKPLVDFTDILEEYRKIEIVYPIEDDLLKLNKVSDIERLIDNVCTEKNKRDALIGLIRYLSLDIPEVCLLRINKAFEMFTSVRMKDIFYRRFKGDTLQSISESYHVTREWVRQLESRARDVIAGKINNIGFDLFRFIAIEIDDNIITLDELIKYLQKTSDKTFDNTFLCHIITELFYKTSYVYEKNAHVLIPCEMSSQLLPAIKDIDGMDKIVHKEVAQMILKEIKEKYDTDDKLVRIYFNRKYRLFGNMYCSGRLTLHSIYDYVLKNYYPGGIRLYEEDEINAYVKKIRELFGNIRLPDNHKAISARIMDIGVLYDRGVHIHESYVHINDESIQEICEYIDENPRNIISYAELFSVFEENLKKNNVNNKFILQGLLKSRLEKKYIMGKDYISKKEGWTIDREIEKFILSKKKVSRRDICNEFPGMNEIVFSTNIKKNGNIIAKDGGVYMHVSSLNLKKEDYRIKRLLAEYTDKIPVSSRRIYELLLKTNEDFLHRNDINSHSELFDVLRYMFNTDFRFSRPFISKIGTTDINNNDVAKSLLQDYDIISIEDIYAIFKQNHIKYISLKNILLQLNDEFLQISKDYMGRICDDTIDDADVECIRRNLAAKIDEKGYVAGKALNDFSGYPDIGYGWNSYLLRSIVEKYLTEEIGMIDMITAGLQAMNTIFVKKEFDYMSYSDFLEHVIRLRHEEKPFNNSYEVREWARKEHLDLRVKVNRLRIWK